MSLRLGAAAGLLLAAAAAGCAAPPASAPQPTESCTRLAQAHAQADDDRRTARQRQEEAWKHATPLLMVGHYKNEKHAAQRAEVRMEQLRVEMDAQGCALRG